MRTIQWAVLGAVVLSGAVGAQTTPPVAPLVKAKAQGGRWIAPAMYFKGDRPLTEAAPPSVQLRPEDAIRAALKHKRALFERCFERELRKQAVFSGVVVLSLNVSTEGTITQARVLEGNRREAAVGACIAAKLRTLKLPTVAHDSELVLPIRLEAKLPMS